MKPFLVLCAAAGLAASGPAWGQTGMTLDDFVVRANRIPLNATSMLRPDAYRLKAEAERGFAAVGGEIRQARSAGRPPVACPPDRISLNPQRLLAFLNAVPQPRRRTMSVTDGIRAWYVATYPC